uniref:YqhV family protein n=1 Tax=uncultured Allobacillus sp. TaxID=1638025 RepID=UPI00259A9B7E|nr:YqhV family protein [uncultured Allobacillus sp.]
MQFIERTLLSIIILRILSGGIEITAALVMFKYNDLSKALVINSLLALVGPTILLSTTLIGLYGLAGKISLLKAVCLICGILLIITSLKIK